MKTSYKLLIRILVWLLPFYPKLLSFLMKLYPILDQFIPLVTNILLNQILHRLKNQGLIENYKVNATRISKLHYSVQIQITLSSEKLQTVFSDLIHKALKGLKT